MNPFERLRKTIQNVNLNYEYAQEEPQAEYKTTVNFQTTSRNIQKPSNISNSDQLQRVKEICENQQVNNIKQINQLTNKIQQLQKSLKRSEGVIENQMNEIVELQKENQLLKGNLNQHYSTVVQGDEKERKYKEEIYRINVTVNELAGEIQSQRNSKKQLLKQVQTLKNTLKAKDQDFNTYKQSVETQKLKMASELEERISMYQYNVKKSSQDRRQFKLTMASVQEHHLKAIEAYKTEIDNLRHQLLDTKKALQIESIRKNNLEETLQRERIQFQNIKDNNSKLAQELNQLKENYSKSQKSNEALEKSLHSIGSELAEQKKNVKVKVIEVRDQTLSLELEMYKRQCKDLLQERLIMKNLDSYPSQKIVQSQYRIVNESSSV